MVKRIDTNAEPPIVVLQQNGVEVLRPVGAPVVGATPNPNQLVPPNSATQSNEAPISIPPLIPAQ